MFGNGKLETLRAQHAKELSSLKSENESLQQQINMLEENVEKDTHASKGAEIQDKILKLLLSSYADGMGFLQSTIEENLIMLSDINGLNKQSMSNINTLSNQTNSISNSVENIQEYTIN